MTEATETTNLLKRRIPKADFIKTVREFTRPGRPAYEALARALGDKFGYLFVLVEPHKCALDTCGKTFMPEASSNKYCSPQCASNARQRRFIARHGKAKVA
jgi:hypothetical protein